MLLFQFGAASVIALRALRLILFSLYLSAGCLKSLLWDGVDELELEVRGTKIHEVSILPRILSLWVLNF